MAGVQGSTSIVNVEKEPNQSAATVEENIARHIVAAKLARKQQKCSELKLFRGPHMQRQ